MTDMNREEALTLIEHGITSLNEALRAGHSDSLKRFLSVLARFHNYSFQNALLIALQRPQATQVAGFHTWKKLGRFVKKGEHGISILAPMLARKKKDTAETVSDCEEPRIRGFKIAHVFDVGQTDGKPLPEFASASGEPGQWLSALELALGKAGITLLSDYIFGGALGCSTGGCIIVRPDLDATERFAVLVHEWAHEILHQKTRGDRATTRKVRETEAEAVAFIVCRACGIDSTVRSADYIQLYRGVPATLQASLTYLHQAAGEILAALNHHHDLRPMQDVMSLSA
jgi:antirestriction protein ArdC